MNPELNNKICHIESLHDMHLSGLKELLEADEGNAFGLDFLAAAAYKRSMSLCTGFTTLVRSENYQCSAALVRLQLDTALRFFAAFIVDKPHDFAIEVLKGEHIRKMIDRDGNKMTDQYLKEILGKKYEWVPRVYDATSGFIHLSDKHIFSIWEGQNDNTFSMRISAVDEHFSDELWIEMADAFIASTDVLFEYLNGWVFTKQNPELVARNGAKMRGEFL